MSTTGAEPTEASVHPEETIRSDLARAPATGLPSISVDLRGPPAPVRGAGDCDLEVRGLIGEGGMGRVLLVRQHSLARDVAVKTVKPGASEAARGALLAEGAITGQLEHPSIVPVHALGLDAGGSPVLVMKRIEGVTWSALLDDPGHPGWEGWEGDRADRLPGHLQILGAVCNALHFAHSRGVVHRDVKPQNVLIGRFGDVYLADWGVAGELGSRTLALCGTPGYLAPEMAGPEVVDARTDVYLLGATLHQLLTGALRHPGPTVGEALAHARSSPPFEFGPQVPAELARLANAACHLEPGRRPESARAFGEALKRHVRHQDAVALGAQALAKLDELERLLEAVDADAARVERLSTEARYGLKQSLELWDGNATARSGLSRVDAILEERRRRAAALEAESRERDPSRGAGWRTVGMATLTGVVTVVAVLATWSGRESTPVQILALPGVVMLTMVVGATVLRRGLLGTRFNRQVFAGIFLSVGFVLVGRVLGLVALVPVPVQFARDGMVMAVAAAVVALGWLRWAWWVSAIFAATSAAYTLWPAQVRGLFGFAAAAALAIATTVSWLDARALRRRGPGPW